MTAKIISVTGLQRRSGGVKDGVAELKEGHPSGLGVVLVGESCLGILCNQQGENHKKSFLKRSVYRPMRKTKCEGHR